MLDQTFFGGFFPHLEADEAGSTAFYDPLWTTDPHTWSYNVGAPSYFPDYFMRPGWEVFPEAVVAAVAAPSGVRRRRTLAPWEMIPEPAEPAPAPVVRAVKKFIKRGVAAVREAEPVKLPPQLRGQLTQVAPGIFIKPSVIDTYSPPIAYLLLDSIKRATAGKPLAPLAEQVASQLQQMIEDEEEEFLLALLLTEVDVF